MVFGVVALVLGIVLIVFSLRTRKKISKIEGTPTTTASELISLKGSGSSTQGAERTVEVKGIIRCDKPLRSPILGKECVYFKSSEREKSEHIHYRYDSENRKHRTCETKYRTIRDETGESPFWCEDPTGRVLIEPAGAEIDGEKVLDRFEPVASTGHKTGFLNTFFGSDEGTKVLGRELAETVLPVGKQVYVLGSFDGSGFHPSVVKPKTGGSHFLITLKSEDELVASLKSTFLMSFGGGILLTIAGIIGIFLGAR